jgi:hypothetical protein
MALIGKKEEVQHDLIYTEGIKIIAMSCILQLSLFSPTQLGSGFGTGTVLFT